MKASAQDHLNSLVSCFQELKLRRKEIEQEDRMYLLLGSLSSEYDSLITVLEGQDAAVLT